MSKLIGTKSGLFAAVLMVIVGSIALQLGMHTVAIISAIMWHAIVTS